MKNEGVRRKRGWMIDARNEDELKSGADLSGWLSQRILDKFPRSNTRGEFATLSLISMQDVVNKVDTGGREKAEAKKIEMTRRIRCDSVI